MTKKKRGKTQRKRKQATRLPTVDEIMNDNTDVIVHADGSKTIKAGPAMQAIMRQQRESFREKFGRDPLPHEPVFFDPDADEPQPIEDEPMDDLMASAAQQAGISEEIIYAMQKTGMIIVAGVNEHLFTTEDKEEWLAAIDEFRARD